MSGIFCEDILLLKNISALTRADFLWERFLVHDSRWLFLIFISPLFTNFIQLFNYIHMLTKTEYQAQVPSHFKKTDVIHFQWVERIVMAVLQADTENPVTYSVCNAEDLKWSLHWVTLDGATRIPTDSLSETIRQRAKNFA
jgi:hypothetical protein